MRGMLCWTASLTLILGVTAASAAEPGLYPEPSALKWAPAPSNVPKGAEIAVLAGDPSKSGDVFVIRLKLPSNYAIPAHNHPTTENVTIVTGTLYAGMGDTLDRDASKPFAAGGFAAMPANMNHYAWTKEPAVIQVEAEGPFAITYVNPADDPSKAQ